MAAFTSALIFVGFWLTGILSQSPRFRSYSIHLTSLIPRGLLPCSDMGCGGRYLGFIPTPSLLCKQRHMGKSTGTECLLEGPRALKHGEGKGGNKGSGPPSWWDIHGEPGPGYQQ